MSGMQEESKVVVQEVQSQVVDQEKSKEASVASRGKKLYRNVKPIVEEKIYFREDEDNVYCFLEDDIKDLKIEEFSAETLKIKKGSWGLLQHIDSLSARYNQMGMRLSNDGTLAENTIRYLLKETSFIDLKFEIDDVGHERIAGEVWVDMMAGDSFLPPTVMITLYRVIKKHNIM